MDAQRDTTLSQQSGPPMLPPGTLPGRINKRYKVSKVIGQGAYGFILAAKDQVSGRSVALKKLTLRQNSSSYQCLLALREIRVTSHFHHDNIATLLDVIIGDGDGAPEWDTLYLVAPLMHCDLNHIIRNPMQELTENHIKYFVYQMLRGLKCIHAANVIHRDLKPSNVLVNKSYGLKISDFGLSRGLSNVREGGSQDGVPPPGVQNHLTEYVTTRNYRAPELLVENKTYDFSIDMWSVGCIMAELIDRSPLFCGEDARCMLQEIVGVLGTPSDEDLACIEKRSAISFLRSLHHRAPVSFKELFPNATPDMLDLLQNLLQFSPHRRFTVDQALAHPFLSQLHELNTEPTAPPFDCEWEKGVHNVLVPELKNLIRGAAHKIFKPGSEFGANPKEGDTSGRRTDDSMEIS